MNTTTASRKPDEHAAAIEKVLRHIVDHRLRTLGPTHSNRGGTWKNKIRVLLTGCVGKGGPLTGDQICDIFDFAIQNDFWRQHISEPVGLAKHAHKIFLRGDYLGWSLENDRPKANRPPWVERPPSRHPVSELPENHLGWEEFFPGRWATGPLEVW